MPQPIPKALKRYLFDEAQIQIREAEKTRDAAKVLSEEPQQAERVIQEVTVSKRLQRKAIVKSIRVDQLI